MGLLDYLLIGAVALGVGKAIHTVVKNKKQGASCCGSCAGCPHNCPSRK